MCNKILWNLQIISLLLTLAHNCTTDVLITPATQVLHVANIYWYLLIKFTVKVLGIFIFVTEQGLFGVGWFFFFPQHNPKWTSDQSHYSEYCALRCSVWEPSSNILHNVINNCHVLFVSHRLLRDKLSRSVSLVGVFIWFWNTWEWSGKWILPGHFH